MPYLLTRSDAATRGGGSFWTRLCFETTPDRGAAPAVPARCIAPGARNASTTATAVPSTATVVRPLRPRGTPARYSSRRSHFDARGGGGADYLRPTTRLTRKLRTLTEPALG